MVRERDGGGGGGRTIRVKKGGARNKEGVSEVGEKEKERMKGRQRVRKGGKRESRWGE